MTSTLFYLVLYSCSINVTANEPCPFAYLQAEHTIPRNPATAPERNFFRSHEECMAVGNTTGYKPVCREWR